MTRTKLFGLLFAFGFIVFSWFVPNETEVITNTSASTALVKEVTESVVLEVKKEKCVESVVFIPDYIETQKIKAIQNMLKINKELTELKNSRKIEYTEEEYDLLCRLIQAEVGGEYILDYYDLSEDEFNRLIRAATSVVINRVKSDDFPDCIYDVIYDCRWGIIQYSPAYNGGLNNTPTDRVKKNVKFVLENGSICPENVIYQDSQAHGSGVWETIANQKFSYK
jgi:hypothetical protein